MTRYSFPTDMPQAAEGSLDREALLAHYRRVRAFTEALCEPLETEDFVVQTMPDVSPTRWHIAHVSWYFETFALERDPGFEPYHPAFRTLFNSYYNGVGDQWHRPHRGLLTRPTVKEVFAYRASVDERMARFIESIDDATWREVAPVIEIGLHHEEQHQELMLTDIKHVLGFNPLRPAYKASPAPESPAPHALGWHEYPGGLVEIGHPGKGFGYDNEFPRHKRYLQPFALASRLVSCGEYLEFMADGGYERPELWLSKGFATKAEAGWRAPLYWEERDGEWFVYTLHGLRRVDPAQPVCHVSYFEADAYAEWAGARLVSEPEWESVARDVPIPEQDGRFVEGGELHPQAAIAAGEAAGDRAPLQLWGDCWEWTSSNYAPYPGYRPPEGALGEYNGKFMIDQMTLRGGCSVVPRGLITPTYRNFFPTHARWQMTGIRLAKTL